VSEIAHVIRYRESRRMPSGRVETSTPEKIDEPLAARPAHYKTTVVWSRQ
jgi:hypothetical protein